MREHLFKALRSDGQGWVEGFYYAINGKAFIHQVENDGKNWTSIISEVDPATVCEATGLTDKNGVRIFEADEIQYEDGQTTPVSIDDGMTLVWFKCGNGRLVLKQLRDVAKYVKVVRNIHDPEVRK